jgi:hypothetical protein
MRLASQPEISSKRSMELGAFPRPHLDRFLFAQWVVKNGNTIATDNKAFHRAVSPQEALVECDGNYKCSHTSIWSQSRFSAAWEDKFV